MKKQFLRVLSILLSLTLFLGIVPTAALTVLAEALTPEKVSDVTNIEVTPDNMAWEIVYTGEGEDPLWMMSHEFVNSWTDEEKAAASWEIIPGVYDDDWNFVEVTSGHFEYLWFYAIGRNSWIEHIAPIGKTSGWWQPKVQKYWEENPDDMECIGLVETMDGWTSDPSVPMLNTFGELTGLSGDYYVPYTLMAFIRYVPDEGEAVMSYGAQQLNMIELPDGADYIPESIHTKPVNWKYSTAIQNHTVKAAIGQPYTPAVYQNYFIARDVGYTMGAGSLCGGAYGASCYCYMMGWMTLRDGVEIADFTGDPSQFIPIGMDDATWEDLLVEYADDYEALYEYLCWGPGDFTNDNSVPLYMTENLATGSTDFYSNSSNLADYSEYTIVPVVRLETWELILNDDGEEEWVTKMLYTVGEPITIVPVEPGEDVPDGVDSEVPVFKEASPLPKDIIVGIDPSQIEDKLVCDASYGERLITYQWYFSETPDYNGVPVNNGSGHEQSKEFYPEPPNATELDKAFYYYCEYSFVNINGITETYYTTITKVRRTGALAIDVTVTPGQIYMGEGPGNTDNFKSYYTRFNSSNLDLWNKDFTIPYAYQSKGSDSVLSAWIEPTVGYGKFKYSDYITYQWFKSDTADYTTGEAVSDVVTINGLGEFNTSRTSVNGLRSYPDYNAVNQYANIHIDCPTDEVGEFYMTVVLKNYYTDERQVQHVYETYSTCRVTTFEKNEDLYHVTKDGELDAYNGHEDVMTIPAEVNGIKVTSLGALACQFKSMSADADIAHVAGARKIIFPEGLTEVSDYAFFRLFTLEDIVFSSTITTIGKMALSDTGRIKNLVIPATITTIENSAFRKSRIEQLTFDENVWPDFGNAFYDSFYLHTVILPANVTGDIGGAFYGCLQLIRVENYENITYVRDDPNFNLVFTSDFFGCPASEYIEDNVGGCDGNFTYILNEDGASWCITEAWGDYLEHVTFPATYKGLPVTVLGRGTGTWGQSNMLNEHLVKWPEYLKSVTIPDTITTINHGAFTSCENLETVNFHRNISYVGVDAFKFCYRLSSDVVLASGAAVESEAFAFCSNIKKMDAPGARLRAKSFSNCFSLESITSYEPWLPPADYEDGSYKNPYTYSNFLYSNLYTDYSECYLKYWSVTGEPEVGKSSLRRSGDIIYQIVNNKAVPYYYADVDAMEIIVPASIDGYKVTTVDGSFLYWMLSTGYSIEFEEGITTLQSKGTFSEHNVGRVILPNSMVDINDFFAESLLEEVHIPANVINMSFTDCELLHTVTFAEGSKLSEISAQAFYGCTALKTVEFEKLTNLKTICRSAFNGTGLETVDLTANTNLKTIEQDAFYHTPLKAVRLPEGLETIEKNAFAADEWEGDGAYYVATLDPMTELVLPEGLKYIGGYAFYGRFMDNAENAPFLLDLPDSVETLCNGAFGGYFVPAYNGELLVNNIQLAKEKLPASLKAFGGGSGSLAPFSYSQIDTLVFQPNIEELLNTLEMRSLNKIVFEGEPRIGSNLRVLRALFDDSSENCEIVGWDNLQKLEIIEGVSFGGWQYDKEEYTLPSSLIKLNSFGGWDSTAFDTIIIPHGVQYIGSVPCVSTPENPRKIIAYGTSASTPELHDYWLQYNHSLIASQGYELATLYCYTDTVYHEWAVKHNYPYVLMDEGVNTTILKFYDKDGKRLSANDYFQSIVWKDKNGNVIGNQDRLINVIEGEEYSYELTFYNDKSWQYRLPFASGTVTAIEGSASVNLTITPIDQMTLSGTFVHFDEPGFSVQVQTRATAKDSWRTVATLTAADLGENGELSQIVNIRDVRLIMEVADNSKCVKTSQIFLSKTGYLNNGVLELGNIEMDYKGPENFIPLDNSLANVQDLILITADGTTYSVRGNFTTLNITEAIEGGVQAGDTVTLTCADNPGGYGNYVEPYTFQVPYDGTGVSIAPVVKKLGSVEYHPDNEKGYMYIYDADGELVVAGHPYQTYFLRPGTYTVFVMERWAKWQNIANFDNGSLSPDSYRRETITVEYESETQITGECPAWINVPLGLSASISYSAAFANTYGYMPVTLAYTLDSTVPSGPYTIQVVSTGGDNPFAMVGEKYAYLDDKLSDASMVSQVEGRTLTITVPESARKGTITFYAKANGYSLNVMALSPYGDNKYVTYTTCRLPNTSFRVSEPVKYTNQSSGVVRVFSASAQGQYRPILIVDDEVKEFGVEIGSCDLPFTFKTYSDGYSEHLVQVIITDLMGNQLYVSDLFTVTHLNRPAPEIERLDIRVLNLPDGADFQPDLTQDELKFDTINYGSSWAHYDFKTNRSTRGVIRFDGEPFNEDGTLKNELYFSFALKAGSGDLGNEVSLYVYCNQDNPVVYTVPLNYENEQKLYIGTLRFERNTYRTVDMPYSFAVNYEYTPLEPISQQSKEDELLRQYTSKQELIGSLTENASLRYQLLDLDKIRAELENMEDLTAQDRDDLMTYYSWQNKLMQAYNDAADGFVATLNEDVDWSNPEEMQEYLASMGMYVETFSLADDPPTSQELLDEGYDLQEVDGKPIYMMATDVGFTGIYLDENDPSSSFMMLISLDSPATFACLPPSAYEADAKAYFAEFAGTMRNISGWTVWALTVAEKAIDAVLDVFLGVTPPADTEANKQTLTKLLEQYEQEMKELRAKNARLNEAQKKADLKLLEKGVNPTQKLAPEQVRNVVRQMQELKHRINNIKGLMNTVSDVRAAANAARAALPLAKAAASAVKVLPIAGCVLSLACSAYDIVVANGDIKEIYDVLIKNWAKFHSAANCTECINLACYGEEAEELIEKMNELDSETSNTLDNCYTGKTVLITTDIGAALASMAPGAGLAAALVSAVSTCVSYHVVDRQITNAKKDYNKDYNKLYSELMGLKKDCKDPSCGGGGGGGSDRDPGQPGKPGENDIPDEPPYPMPFTGVYDPAGYVYEAVASNRVQGATAKVYYLDENGNETYWAEAADYGEINPQITDENGVYAWMTPQGKWKVRVTKDGYYDADSTKDPAADADGWLPVPPPQTAVYIPMVSKAAPTIQGLTVAPNRIQLIFSQYMDIAQLTANNSLITVTMDGVQVPISFTFADAEVSPTQEGVYYGRILNITPTNGVTFSGENIVVSVDATLQNYAGTAFGVDYQSNPLKVTQIADTLSHSYPNRLVLDVDETVEIALQVSDTEGKSMAGVEVTMVEHISGLLEVHNYSAVSDENGRVIFNITGVLAGPEYLMFTTENGVAKLMEVRVDEQESESNQPTKPTANLSDYSVVDCNTQLVISTDVEGGIIYYTTNDTCPCTESENRKVYTGPIDLTESAFYRIAVWTEEGGYSERLNLHLTVEHDYAEDGVTCNRCGSSEGDDPIVEDILTFDGYSVSEDVNGLAFRFTIDVTGMTQKGTTAVYDNAKVTYNGQEYSLVGMGAIVSNDADVELTRENIDGVRTIDVFAKYLWSMDEDSASYAVRVIDIPENGKDTTVYARAYFVIEVEGEQVVVYADDIAEQTYNGVLNG